MFTRWVNNNPYSDYSDADQAALMEATLKLLFSHPSVKGITLWGFWEGNIWIPNSGAPSWLCWVGLVGAPRGVRAAAGKARRSHPPKTKPTK